MSVISLFFSFSFFGGIIFIIHKSKELLGHEKELMLHLANKYCVSKLTFLFLQTITLRFVSTLGCHPCSYCSFFIKNK